MPARIGEGRFPTWADVVQTTKTIGKAAETVEQAVLGTPDAGDGQSAAAECVS